jgi:hypothetical protein
MSEGKPLCIDCLPKSLHKARIIHYDGFTDAANDYITANLPSIIDEYRDKVIDHLKTYHKEELKEAVKDLGWSVVKLKMPEE